MISSTLNSDGFRKEIEEAKFSNLTTLTNLKYFPFSKPLTDFPSMAFLKVVDMKEKGRGLITEQAIKAGSIFWTEKPLISVSIHPDACFHCCKLMKVIKFFFKFSLFKYSLLPLEK